MAFMRKKCTPSPFPHPWRADFWGLFTKCIDDWLIIDISDQIRQKPDWQAKFQNPEIASKWKAELLSQEHDSHNFDEVFDYVLKELEWYKAREDELLESGFKFATNELVLFSDSAISTPLKNKFMEAEKQLEAAIEKDYHPNSHNQVVDIVHPSLYPVVYGRTKELKNGVLNTVKFTEEIINVKNSVQSFGRSYTFQWLPAKMKPIKDTKKFEFVSYINNLHPIQFSEMYELIADIFNASLPGLTRCLSQFAADPYIRTEIPEGEDAYTDEYNKKKNALYESDVNLADMDDAYDELERERVNYVKKCPPVWKNGPEPADFDLSSFDNLKVIVKLANIELTPELPRYEGGSWHVEGTINEDIVATVLYYYDVENIEDSKLSFRESLNDPSYEQGDETYCEHFYGIKDGDVMRKLAGSVVTKQDRILIFPNTFQHHVDAFELSDKSRPGHRKILCFFIVDPHNDVIKSSETIPPQQLDWAEDTEIRKKYFPELNESVLTMSKQEAFAIRRELMEERSAQQAEEIDDGESPFYRSFSLCEH